MSDLEKVVLSNHQTPVLLAVLAHPDDETFGTGGTLALYARKGVKVYLACATQGEVGEMDPALMRGFSTIGERRVAELRCAAEKLGLTDVFFLGYRDSGMPGSPDNHHPQALVAQPLESVAADVVHIIRKVQPQVVVTFDPIGGYRHPDHIHIHQATARAFYDARNPDCPPDPEGLSPYAPAKLYFQTIPHSFLKAAVPILRLFGRDPRHFGVNGDVDLVSIAEVSFPIHTVINFRPVAAIRDEAAACHASQGGQAMSKGVMGVLSRLFRSGEAYMRAYPEPNKGEKREKDLFAGL
jgi:N-acetyl-1-D-myo-inositol-2-amino-2-deoxy-alpha-D-glucopyranoside deacetylase